MCCVEAGHQQCVEAGHQQARATCPYWSCCADKSGLPVGQDDSIVRFEWSMHPTCSLHSELHAELQALEGLQALRAARVSVKCGASPLRATETITLESRTLD